MVIVSVYGYIGKQTDGIDRHIDRHKDMEIWSREQGTERFTLNAYCLGVGCQACCWLSACRFTLVYFGPDFCLYKKFF